MKHLSEYREPEMVRNCIDEINRITTRPWHIMEVCGGQTHGLVKNGIQELLPEGIQLIHGPGCPVCVTPIELIDHAIELATREGVILCSFGDMLRVPGSDKSLLQARAEGGDVRVVYSPLDAVDIAREIPDRQVVFFAVGFETTAPANALSVLQADRLGLKNYSILTSQVIVPPALEAILDDPDSSVDGFLAAGHVCAIMGLEEYEPIAHKYGVPIIATGFEPVDLVQGILMVVRQLESGQSHVENQYSRAVPTSGNTRARDIIQQAFSVTDRKWRGFGKINNSGYRLKEPFVDFDAARKFGLTSTDTKSDNDCRAGDVLKGILKPISCPHFGNKCNPEHPLGAPMVSSEGACAAYYYYSSINETI